MDVNGSPDLYYNTGKKNEMSAFTKVSYSLDGAVFYGDIQFRNVYFEYIPEHSYNMNNNRIFNSILKL